MFKFQDPFLITLPLTLVLLFRGLESCFVFLNASFPFGISGGRLLVYGRDLLFRLDRKSVV